MIKKYLFTIAALLSLFTVNAQTYNPDKNGHVSDPKFRQLIKSRGIELVGAFDTLQRNPLIIAASFQKNGKWGRIDNHGKIIEDAKAIDYATNKAPREIKGDPFLNEGERSPYNKPVTVKKVLFTKYNNNGKWGTHDAAGKEGIPAIYDYLSFYNDSTVNVRTGNQYGAFTVDGKVLVPVAYDGLYYSFGKDQAFVVKKGKLFGVYFQGKEILPIQYDRIAFDSRFKNLLKVTSNDRVALFSVSGKPLTQFSYTEIRDFSTSGVAMMRTGLIQDAKVGMLDTMGKEILAPTYKEISGFNATLYRTIDGKYPHQTMGLINLKGKPVSQQDYSRIEYLSNGLARVMRDSKMGFIDSAGNEVIKPVYTSVEYFNKTGFSVMRMDTKYGLISRKDEVIVQPVYDLIELNGSRKMYYIGLDRKRGLMDMQGKVVLPPTYDQLYAIAEYGYRATLDQKQGLLDDNGVVMVPLKYDVIEPPNQYKILDHGLIKAILNGKKCRVDLYGNEYFEKVPVEKTTDFTPDKNGFVSGPEFQQFIKQRGFQLVGTFDTLERKSPVLVARVMLDGKWILMDTKGQYIKTPETPTFYNDVKQVRGDMDISIPDMRDQLGNSGFEQVVVNGKYGTLNKTNNKIGLPAIYDNLSFMGQGWVMIRLAGKYGMAMDDGNVVIPPKYESITPGNNNGKFSFEQFFVRDGGKYGLISANGSEIIPIKYDQLLSCEGVEKSKLLLKFSLEKKWGLITKKGKILVEPAYDELTNFCPGLFRAAMGTYPRQYGLIDTTGKVVLEPVYKSIEVEYYKKMIHISAGPGKQGYLAMNGKMLFKPIYDEISDFSNGLARVRLNGKYGLMKEDEKFIIEPGYDQLFILRASHLVAVEIGHKKGIVDMKGNKVIPIEYDELYQAGANFVFKRNEKWGIMTPKEKVLTTLDYESVSPGFNCFIVQLNGKYGLMANDGKLITAIKYGRFPSGSFTMNHGLAETILNGNRITIDYYGNEYSAR
jgi:hypothetical protein